MANEEIYHDEAVSKHLLSIKKKVDARNIEKEAMTPTDVSCEGPEVPTMCWVPTLLRSQNPAAYRPNTVSIGPLHSSKKNKEKLVVKIRYMRSLFHRTGASEATERACMAAMLQMETLVRLCYIQVQLQEDLELAEMMLVDGCFIVELLFRNFKKDYNDPFLRNPFDYHALQHDLMLLENQIPFFVLQELFRKTVGIITSKENNKPTLTNIVLSFFGDMMGMTQVGTEEIRYDTYPDHILHLLHRCYIPAHKYSANMPSTKDQSHKYSASSATRLDMAGIKFQANKTYGDPFDIKFSTGFRCSLLCLGGTIQIPHFSISESTEPFLRNLIAFEQCNPRVKSFFTSHAFLMDILIDSGRDVELLDEAEIIDNHLGSSAAVCRVFNDICKNIAVPRHFLYGRLLEDVNLFCTPCQVKLGRLMHNYFGNVWVRISVFAAFILFILTLLQTIYTLRSYYHI